MKALGIASAAGVDNANGALPIVAARGAAAAITRTITFPVDRLRFLTAPATV